MKSQSQPTAQTRELPADEPVVLPIAVLDQVAGGLPYHGFATVPVGGEGAAGGSDAALPYHGF